MLNITLDLDTGLAKLASATTIKAGADVPVTITTVRGTTPTSPGASPAFELGLGTDATPPVLKAYLDTFTAENDHTFTGVLDANDERLVAFMAGKGTVNFGCEVAWTVAGQLEVAPSFTVPVQARVIPSDPNSESGPHYYTEAEVDALLAEIPGGGDSQPLDATLTSLSGKSLSGTGNVVLQSALDAVIAGLKFKQSVRVATAFTGTLATAFANGQTIDGVTLATGDRILIKNQAFPNYAENGIYVVNASGAPTRASDFDAAGEIPGALVAVERGTVNADTIWLCTNDSITLGTTAINFVPFGASGIPSQSGQDGKALVTNGSAMTWQAVGLRGESVTVQGYTSPAVAEAFAIAVIDYSGATIGADLTLGGITHTLLAPPTAGERPALENMPSFIGWTLDDPAGAAWRYTKDAAGSTSASMEAGGGEPALSFTNGNTATAAAGEIAEVTAIAGVAGKRIRGVAGYLECSGALGANTVALYHRTLDMESVETLTQITVPQNASGPFVLNHRLGAVGSESGESIILRFTGDVADYADPALTATAHVTCSQQ